jgi:hypothetical protein
VQQRLISSANESFTASAAGGGIVVAGVTEVACEGASGDNFKDNEDIKDENDWQVGDNGGDDDDDDDGDGGDVTASDEGDDASNDDVMTD